MNFTMAVIYRMMFQNKMPKVFLEMEQMLQFDPHRKVGDWFLLKEHTIIRVYGFVHEPYILPAFLTTRIFSLYFITRKLTVENELFINFKKAFEIKFPLKVVPFIIKNKDSLPMIEGILKDMNFMKATKVNYDPHHIISQRRQLNKNKSFEHQ